MRIAGNPARENRQKLTFTRKGTQHTEHLLKMSTGNVQVPPRQRNGPLRPIYEGWVCLLCLRNKPDSQRVTLTLLFFPDTC